MIQEVSGIKAKGERDLVRKDGKVAPVLPSTTRKNSHSNADKSCSFESEVAAGRVSTSSLLVFSDVLGTYGTTRGL